MSEQEAVEQADGQCDVMLIQDGDDLIAVAAPVNDDGAYDWSSLEDRGE